MGYGRRTCVGRIAGGRQDVRGGSVIWTVMAARQERRLPTTGKPVPTNSSDTSVTAGEIMSSPVGVIDVDESLWDAALRLSSGSRDRLVVLDRGRRSVWLTKRSSPTTGRACRSRRESGRSPVSPRGR